MKDVIQLITQDIPPQKKFMKITPHVNLLGKELLQFEEKKITLLFVDDQEIFFAYLKKSLAECNDIQLHYCKDPKKAIETANKIQPTIILQDLVMPDIDGLTLIKEYRKNQETANVPLIVLSTLEEASVKAEAFALGANDYMVKLPQKIELEARIRYHSKSYTRLLQRNEIHEKLRYSQKVLINELKEAAQYVSSILPDKMEGEIKTDWKFIPSQDLGGDTFGYHWVDDDHFAIYLIDVCGHGIGAALLSISLLNVIRSHSLPQTDFKDPSQVLESLNKAFPMEKHKDMFFTIWYGIYNKNNRTLSYSSGGHPPALLLQGNNPENLILQELATEGLIVGGVVGTTYETKTISLKEYNQLLVFSDGVFELEKEEGEMLRFQEFVDLVKALSDDKKATTDSILKEAKKLNKEKPFEDDFSLLIISF